MNRPARFLVLMQAAVQRALLFDIDQRLLGEVIEDDGYIVDRLLLGARPCDLPHAGMLQGLVPLRAPHSARCFELV